jgi:hypothetical protein
MKSESDTTMKLSTGLSLMAITFVYGCKKPYAPVIITVPNNYLVVEGVINSGADSTIIKLSRTVNLSGATAINPELGATVTVEGDQGVSYPLPQVDSGRYAAPPLNLDNSRKYRLLITTAAGKSYASDYEPVKITPPIDTLRYEISAAGVNLFTSTHDPANNTHYYRWDYTETYIYESTGNTYFKFDNTQYFDANKVRFRTPDEQIHVCYVTDTSSTTILNSTAALKQDIVVNNPITQVPASSEKLYYRYSILVKQYALTQEAYNFWSILKKNTEQIGTIFDAQPSELKGNIHCISNPKEPVLGYISVSTVSQKRVFISNSQLPGSAPPADTCQTYSYSWYKGAPASPELVSGVAIPIGLISSGYSEAQHDSVYSVKAYIYDCVDCRYHLHGRTTKPSFWTER